MAIKIKNLGKISAVYVGGRKEDESDPIKTINEPLMDIPKSILWYDTEEYVMKYWNLVEKDWRHISNVIEVKAKNVGDGIEILESADNNILCFRTLVGGGGIEIITTDDEIIIR